MEGFSICLGGRGVLGLLLFFFFLERPNSIKGERILSFEKKKLFTPSGLVEKAPGVIGVSLLDFEMI